MDDVARLPNEDRNQLFAVVAELEEDDRKMREMIFGELSSFEHLLKTLADIERQINASA